MSSLTRTRSLFVDDGSRKKDYLSPAKLGKVVSAVATSAGAEENGPEDPEGVSSPPEQEGPFSALTPSMRPSSTNNKDEEEEEEEEELLYDEFGFRLEQEDGPEHCSNKLLRPFQESDGQKRLQWIAHMEFAGKKDLVVAWDEMVEGITRTDKLRSMVMEGVPHSLRPAIWMRLSGATAKRAESEVSYKQIVRASGNDHLMTSRQIEKDLLRTMPTNVCFSNKKSAGVPRLRRVLRGMAWLYPDIGYCQGMGMIAGTFLLLMEEEDSFWMMSSVVEDLLPSSYYSPTLVGVHADQLVLRGLVASFLPALDSLFAEHDIEISLITLNWFLTLYSSVLNAKLLMRLWDLLLFDGSRVLFQAALALLKMGEKELLGAENSAEIFNLLSTLPGRVEDIDELLLIMEEVGKGLTDAAIEDNRRRQVALLLSEQGFYRRDLDGRSGNSSSSSSSRLRLTKRTMKRSKSVMDMLLFTGDNSKLEEKSKNVLQTEVLINLREAIVRVANHFQSSDPAAFEDANINADYSTESHAKDHESFLSISRSKRKRARAILDFERRDDDELGFRKNDLLTIVSQRDEHCWVGELNGQQGWFPAKLVEVLDERSKKYSFAGDDSVSPAVADLARGCFCRAFKKMLEHGLRRSPLLLGPAHPWLFIEEAVAKDVERDFKSVYSRLVLCKTFRLNEDGKVLSPEELLFRCVESVNFTHDPAKAQMDVKLRSLVCLGLNEQVLHLWLEALASADRAVIGKWYHDWSFMASPGWVQVKCELRVLAQFAFNLDQDWEIRKNGGGGGGRGGDGKRQMQDGVKDMLVKHHLFSWDL